MSRFLNNKLFRYLFVFLFLNSSILQVKSSSALAAWALNTNGVLELRTKSNSNLKAYFQKANQIYGDRFWVDFPGELKNPRIIKGNGPIKEIRLGKPNKGKTRLVIEFKEETDLKPLTWRMVGLDENRWMIKLFNPKNSSQIMGRTRTNRLTFVEIPKNINFNFSLGDEIDVRINEARSFSLTGELNL